MSRLFVAVALAGAGAAHAVPVEVTHSGRLLDATGTPLQGTASLTVALWDAATGGTQVWSENHAGVTLEDGAYSVVLGSVTPLDGADLAGDRWLQVTVDGIDVLAPRQPLTSVPFARVAGEVQRPDGTPVIDADGTIHVGDPATCVPGTLRYAAGTLYYCDDTPAWVSLAPPLGSTQATAAEDCQAILDANAHRGSGVYWIDPTGTDPFQVWCDMETNGGGWTLCGKYDRDGPGSRYLVAPFARAADNRQDLASPFSFTGRQASQDCRALIAAGATQILSVGSNGSLPWADGRINDILAEVIADPTNLWDLAYDEESPEQASCVQTAMITRTLDGVDVGNFDGVNRLSGRSMMVGDGAMWTDASRNGAQFSNAGSDVGCTGTLDDTVYWSWRDSAGNVDDHGCGNPVFGTGCAAINATYRYNFMFMR